MIVLNKNAVNEVVLRLQDRSNLQEPVYLLRLVNDTSFQEYSAIITNISDYPEKYSLFRVTEKQNANNLNGELTLANLGFYHYYIYEQTSTTNLDYTKVNFEVDKGKCRFQLLENAKTPKVFYQKDAPTKVIYVKN